MDLGLRGKTAVVAAASRGLGRAIADELAREGVRLVICARGADTLDAARKEIADATDADVHSVVADLSEAAGIERVAAAAREAFGHVDILVNNAGGPPAGPFEKHDWDVWQQAVNLTLRSTVELTRAMLPGMRERKWGRVINVTSIAVKQPVENLMLSNSVRSAVTGFARTLANEVAIDGVTVNNILPGYTRTERVEQLAAANAAKEGLASQDILGRFEREIPMRRLGEPREFAALAAFLASERASYITGQSIAVDGGWIRALL
ncbi:MAG TPA: SDR family oxidoreductase [Gemmatimonadaceae bacterium]|nr:SDR family oxidoreductase [Gemmatimonadaceae bacterium]